MTTKQEGRNPINRNVDNPYGIQKEPLDYYRPAYLDPPRMASYGYQYKLAYESGGMSLLNIGSANNLLSDLLVKQRRFVTNLDLDIRTKPNVLGIFPSLPFKDKSFDVALCFQVLEHLPFSTFEGNLLELVRVSNCVIISLPDISVTNTEIRKFRFFTKFHHPKEWSIYKPRQIDSEHFWEIGDNSITLDSLIQRFTLAHLSVQKQFRNPQNRYHRFFVLKANS